jgi:uncharacterized protein with HEPN domain
MTQHDPTLRIRHMLDHAKEAVDLMAGKEKAALGSDRVLQLALVRLVAIVGEAANRLTIEDQSRYPSIPSLLVFYLKKTGRIPLTLNLTSMRSAVIMM